jgi:hypothetical protein
MHNARTPATLGLIADATERRHGPPEVVGLPLARRLNASYPA